MWIASQHIHIWQNNPDFERIFLLLSSVEWGVQNYILQYLNTLFTGELEKVLNLYE